VAAAAGGKSGYAVVQLDAGNILAVREGAYIAPGIRLSEVRAEQIILDRNGARETLALPEKASRAREAAVPPPPPRQTYPAEPPARAPGTDQR
jgi:general secretion pathway protein C